MLSVIVPMYNSAEYISKCIDSILQQSYQEIEVIIVDDGSTDESLKICNEYKKTDDRIIVISQDNQGPAIARLKGIKEAKGEYVTFVDSDDFIDSMSYIYARDDMESKIDVISFGINRYSDDDNILVEIDDFDEKVYDAKQLKDSLFSNMIWNKEKNKFGLDPSLCSKIFKKELIEDAFTKVGKIRFHYGEDVAVIYPLIKEANSFSVHKKAYYYHRIKKNGIISDYLKNNLFLTNLYDLYISLLNNMNDEIFREQIELFYAYSVQLVKIKYGVSTINSGFVFPFDKVKKGDRVIIYGAGDMGKTYYFQLIKTNYCPVVLWTDKNYINIGSPVDSPDKIFELVFDFIIIAISNEHIKKEIKGYLVNNGVSIEKII